MKMLSYTRKCKRNGVEFKTGQRDSSKKMEISNKLAGWVYDYQVFR